VVRRVGDAISDHDYGGGCRRVNLGLRLMAGEQGSSVAWGVCPAIDASLLSLLGSAAAGAQRVGPGGDIAVDHCCLSGVRCALTRSFILLSNLHNRWDAGLHPPGE
jgi:hypothetical protein